MKGKIMREKFTEEVKYSYDDDRKGLSKDNTLKTL
jgi:hypothetical protein